MNYSIEGGELAQGEAEEYIRMLRAQHPDRIRRITGYLVGSLDRFNDAKHAEVLDRVDHSIV